MKILVYPKYSNPYQELLYKSVIQLYGSKVKIRYCGRFPLVGPLFFPFQIAIRRLQGYSIIHIHWPIFHLSLPLPFRKRISLYIFIFCIALLETLQFKIIWTVHNILPHERQTSDDLRAIRYLSIKAKAKIVHSEQTVKQMKKLGLNTNHTIVIPHGNYCNVYPNKITRAEARKKLGIDAGEFVLLFFGMIRPYKGVDDLLNSFLELNLPRTRLLIVGTCLDKSLEKKILSAQDYGVNFYKGHIADREVSLYFKASDIVCLPFRSVTTSGSALLALSLGKPIIAPLSGTLLDLPHDVGYLYDKEGAALTKSLHKAFTNKDNLQFMGRSALSYARSLDWNEIARKTYKVYQQVIK